MDTDSLKEIIAARCKAARKGAGMTSEQAATAIGHKNSTQLSLIESADRKPSLETLCALATTYAVPTDYLLGLIDDQIAEPLETNQGVIARSINNSIAFCMKSWGDMVSKYTALAVMNHSRDRVELLDMCQSVETTLAAMHRIKQLNPSFDDDIRGGSKLELALDDLSQRAAIVENRMKRERIAREELETEIEQQDMFAKRLAKPQQMILEIFTKIPQ